MGGKNVDAKSVAKKVATEEQPGEKEKTGEQGKAAEREKTGEQGKAAEREKTGEQGKAAERENTGEQGKAGEEGKEKEAGMATASLNSGVPEAEQLRLEEGETEQPYTVRHMEAVAAELAELMAADAAKAAAKAVAKAPQKTGPGLLRGATRLRGKVAAEAVAQRLGPVYHVRPATERDDAEGTERDWSQMERGREGGVKWELGAPPRDMDHKAQPPLAARRWLPKLAEPTQLDIRHILLFHRDVEQQEQEAQAKALARRSVIGGQPEPEPSKDSRTSDSTTEN